MSNTITRTDARGNSRAILIQCDRCLECLVRGRPWCLILRLTLRQNSCDQCISIIPPEDWPLPAVPLVFVGRRDRLDCTGEIYLVDVAPEPEQRLTVISLINDEFQSWSSIRKISYLPGSNQSNKNQNNLLKVSLVGGSREEHCAGTILCRLLGAYIHYGSVLVAGSVAIVSLQLFLATITSLALKVKLKVNARSQENMKTYNDCKYWIGKI